MRSNRFNATTSVVDFGVQVAQTPTAQSVLALCYPIGAGENNLGMVISRNEPEIMIGHNTGSPRLEFQGTSGTADRPYRTTDNNTIVYGAWHHIATTWDGSITNANIHHYIGLRGAALTEPVYGFSQDGSGSAGNGSANALTIGNQSNGTTTFNGDIVYVAQWNRVLSLVELLNAQRYGPLAVRGGLILFWDGERDRGPYRLKPAITALTPGFTVPSQFNPTAQRPAYYRANAAAVTTKFRKTLSGIGSRTGVRQTHGWS